jgi:hypothetical protein
VDDRRLRGRAALFGYPPVLVAAAGMIEEGEADWIADVQRYVDSYAAGTAGPRDAVA